MSNYNNNTELFSKLSNEWYLAVALYDAIDDGNLREATALIYEKHTNPNIIIPDYGITPFHIAVGHENQNFAKEITKILLKNGGNPNVKGHDGITPLHVAAAWNRAAIVRLLLSYGADPLVTDDIEKNAFHYAYEEHAWETLKTLEIHRRVESNNLNKETKKNYKVELDKVIIQSNDVQAEYKALCNDTEKNVPISKNTVGTQTPIPFFKIGPSSDNDEFEINAGTINSLYDWCHQASNIVITNECKQKIITHRVNSKTYEYNPIFDSNKFKYNDIGNEHGVNLKKKYFPSMECLNNDAPDKYKLKNSNEFHVSNSLKKETKYFSDEIDLANFNDLNQQWESNKKSNDEINENVCELNESFENLISSSQMTDWNSITDIVKEDEFQEDANIPYIDESLSESSQKHDKDNRNEDTAAVNNEQNSEKSESNEDSVTVEEKLNVKRVSWSGCLKNCACIPESINDSDNSIYYTNNNSDDDELRLRTEEGKDGHARPILELPNSLLVQDCHPVECDYVKETNRYNEFKDIMTETDCDSNDFSDKSHNISIEYKVTDDEDGIEFIEARLPLCNSLNKKKESKVKCNHKVSETDNSDSGTYDSDYIRKELKKIGFVPGPMPGSTKKLYLRKLRRIRKTIIKNKDVTNIIEPSFSPELEQVLKEDTKNWQQTLSKWSYLENEIRENFLNCSLSSSWRSGTAKTSFTYLLLDPRITSNLPARCEQMDLIDVWRTFVRSIFYIGKGSKGRPYEHLHEAFLIWRNSQSSCARRIHSLKVRHIVDVWKEGSGVVCVQVFHNIIQAEAYTREAAMIDAIGLPRLKNEKGGVYYGIAASWNSKLKRRLGTYLLYRAMRVFIADNEVQLKPTDIN